MGRDSLQRVCEYVREMDTKHPKIILMGTVGVPNPDGSDDARSLGDRMILGMCRLLLPPHTDNEAAAKYLGKGAGSDNPELLQWVIVRPDDLIDGEVSEYEIVPKPTGSLFGSAETTRANVAAFMCELILDEKVWNEWLFQAPVVHNVKTEMAK